MAAILNKLWDGYQLLFEEFPDQRTKPWFLVAKPYQLLTVLGIYLMFIFKWGPQWMRKRPAYNLDRILLVYNFLQVAACLYIFIMGIKLAWGWNYKWLCEPLDKSTSPHAMAIAEVVYLYYITKIIDLMDTIFFVLRKKNRQISFLHIYHHTGMAALIWGATTYFPGGHGTLIGVINAFVHIVMYSYYLYTVAVPSAKNSLWWKKYITQLQIVQFFWCVVHMGSIVFVPDCEYPRWVAAVFLPQNVFILVLFIDFYIKAYVLKPQAPIKELKNGHANGGGHRNGSGHQNGSGHKNGSGHQNGSGHKIDQQNGHVVSNENGSDKTKKILNESGPYSSVDHKKE